MDFFSERKTPTVPKESWIAPSAVVCGAVSIDAFSSIWFGAVLRGDVDEIRLGRYCNIQDGAILHCDRGQPVILEDYVTIGHRAVIHSAHLERGCLIGMGAVLLNGVRVGAGSMVGAGAIVTKSVPPKTLVVGTPAKAIRTLDDDAVADLLHHAEDYWTLAIAHQQRQFPEISQDR
ncbi:MAG: gamma carbonic anhydrase family protein [Cyanobacteria bacterium J06648_11]